MQGTSRPPTLAGGRRAWRARHGSKVGPALRLPFSFSFLPLLICTADRARAPPWVKSRNALAFYWCASATCDASGARGEFCRRRERTADATAARPMHAAPCSASLCVCLHHRSVTCSFQPATACDPLGARDQSSHRRGGEAMAAAYPGSSLEPVLGGTCDTPSRTPSCACRCVRLHHRAVVCSVQPATACDLSLFAFHAAGLRRGI